MKAKPIKVLVMSVGQFEKNYTAKYFCRIGARKDIVVCLPDEKKSNAASYQQQGIEVYVYDEKKYINSKFEYFGFKPRNCGGVGRQGIAEAVERYSKDYLCFQVDDDYTGICVRFLICKTVRKWENLKKWIYAAEEFYQKTGCDMLAKTGATIQDKVISNHKVFNNFIMREGNPLNFQGFAALCSDDQRFNAYVNLLQRHPMLSVSWMQVQFNQNQGDRSDGNAILYNSDCSWKKSFALKMMFPWCVTQAVTKEKNRALFRENIQASKLFPPIFLEEGGKLVARVR